MLAPIVGDLSAYLRETLLKGPIPLPNPESIDFM